MVLRLPEKAAEIKSLFCVEAAPLEKSNEINRF